MKKETKQKKKQSKSFSSLPTSVRFSDRWNEWKKDAKEFVLTHFLLLFKIAVALLFVLMALFMFFGKLKPATHNTNKATPTGLLSYFSAPQLVKDLRDMEFLTALTVERDLVVSQFKLQEKNPEPVSVHIQYPCSLVVGIDLDKKKGEWFQIDEDTVILNMPPVEVLTPRKEIVMETHKMILLESGAWSEKELDELHERATYMMTRLSIVEDSCLVIAEKQARRQLLNMIRSHGYKHGVVHFAKNANWKPIMARYKSGMIPNDYNFYTAANGKKMIFYKNGSIIHYDEKIPFDRLYNLAEFSATAFLRPVEITVQSEKKGYTLFLCNTNADIKSEETQNYINFIKTSKEMREDLKKMMQTFSRRLFDNQPCKIIETDANGEVILDYSKL